MTTAAERDALDAQVLAVMQQLAPTRSYVKATVVLRLLHRQGVEVTIERLRGSLTRLDEAGLIAKRTIADGRPTKNREYVLTEKGKAS